MMSVSTRRLTIAKSIDEACAAIGEGAHVIAGGTWLMRAPLRRQRLPEAIVGVSEIRELAALEENSGELVIGAALTHDALERKLSAYPNLAGLRAAAGRPANPPVRRVATLGGNLCCVDFAAADFAPALLAVDAKVDLATKSGPRSIGIADFLAQRSSLLRDALLVAVRVPLAIGGSAHQRLPLRMGGGDYPIAIVSVAKIDDRVQIAVGSVEGVARRWTRLERELANETAPTDEKAHDLAARHNDFTGRDGIEADGWYRREVLPALLARCLTSPSMKDGA